MICVFFCAFFVVWIVLFFLWYELCFFLWYELCFFLCFFLWYELCFFLCFFLWYELCFFLCFFCGMNCAFFCAFFCGMNCAFFCAFFVVWIVLFFVLFFCGMNCAFFCGMNCAFFCAFFCGMNCAFFCAFFLWYELCFFLCFFLWYELCFFLCSGAPEKRKKKDKKAQKKHEKSTISLEKMNLRPPGLDSLRTSGPANVSYHFLFSNLLSKKNSQEWAHARSGNVKKCNYHMMFIKNLNNYCWRHAFVTLFTYNLQWLDRLIAVSRYLRYVRYAAFNIVKNVMSHNIVSSYRCNTLHHHTISLPLLFDTQIFR